MPRIDKNAAVAEYHRLYKELNSLVLAWDPYGLFKAGELSDEFSDEVTQVLAKLPHCKSETDVAIAIQTVFANSFSEHDFQISICESIGSSVYTWWSAQS